MNGKNEHMLKQYGGKEKKEYYSYFPKVVKAGDTTKIKVKSKYKKFVTSGKCIVLIRPYNSFSYKAYKDYKDDFIYTDASENCLEFEYYFADEQAYYFRVGIIGEQNGLYLLFSGMIYALNDDLYTLSALKGDFHSHTVYSDGLEDPTSILCSARKKGLDFLAITDHNNYSGSTIAKDAVKLFNKLNITVISGEEFSSDFTNMHIISLGASKPVNEKYYKRGIEETDNVKFIGNEYKNKVKSDIVAFACTQNLVDAIHGNDGVAVMCHALWKPLRNDGTRGDVPEQLVLDLLRYNRFDAFEVVTGSPIDDSYSTNLQLSLVQEAGLTPDKIAYIGVTDSHAYTTDPICGYHYTIVFSEDNSEKSIIKSVKEKKTVAVDHMYGKQPFCYGSLRLVKYSHFLIKYVFPDRDRIAYLEGLNAENQLISD